MLPDRFFKGLTLLVLLASYHSTHAQELIQNHDNITLFNPAAAAYKDRFSITVLNNYFDRGSFWIQNTSFTNLELDLPKINSGLTFNANYTNSAGPMPFVPVRREKILTWAIGYRYTHQFSENMSLAAGVGVKKVDKQFYQKSFFSSSFFPPFDWKDDLWSLNAGLFFKFKQWTVGASVDDMLEPSFEYTWTVYEMEQPVFRTYHFNIATALEFNKNFKISPKLYLGQRSVQKNQNDRLHYRQIFLSNEFMYFNKFSLAPGFRMVIPSDNQEIGVASFSLHTGFTIFRNYQFGLAAEYFYEDANLRTVTVEGYLRIRLSK